MIAATKNLTPDQELLLDFRQLVTVPRLRPMSVFAEQEIVVPTGPYAGRKFKIGRQPYAGLLFGELGNWYRHVITGPTQSGKTLQAFVIPMMYHLFEVGETVICGLPTLDMASDKWERDLKPVIEASRYRDWLPRRGAGSRGGTPSDVITFGNGAQLKFMGGGGGDKQRAAFTSRVLIITETDGMDESGEASREADKVTQMEGRTRAFGDRARIYMECTVSTTDGKTWREYEAGTASRIAVRCPHCKAWVSPERDHLRGWQEAATELDAEDGGHFVCPACEKPLSDDQRAEMNAAGRLLHRGQEMNARGRIQGDPPRTKTLGFRWSAFNNLFASPGQLAAEEWRSLHSDDSENADRSMKQFVWCIPVVEDRIETSDITPSIVRGSHEDYGGRCTQADKNTVPEAIEALTAFVDVHSRSDRLLYYVVCAWLPGRRCVVIDYDQFGDPGLRDVMGADLSVQANLRDLRRHFLSGVYGRPLDRVLVDAGYFTDLVMREVHEAVRGGLPYIASKGLGSSENDRSAYVHPVKRTKDRIPSPNGDLWYQSLQSSGMWQINMHSDRWKNAVHHAFMLKPLDEQGSHAAGAVRLFGQDPRQHFLFADQVAAEVLQREFSEKGWSEKWIKRRKENHYLDCMYGNFVAASICGVWNPIAKPVRRKLSEIQKSRSKGAAR